VAVIARPLRLRLIVICQQSIKGDVLSCADTHRVRAWTLLRPNGLHDSGAASHRARRGGGLSDSRS